MSKESLDESFLVFARRATWMDLVEKRKKPGPVHLTHHWLIGHCQMQE